MNSSSFKNLGDELNQFGTSSFWTGAVWDPLVLKRWSESIN